MTTRVAKSVCLSLLASGLLAGCASMDSVRSSMKDRFVGMSPTVRLVQGAPRQVYDAARVAMEQLGYRYVRGGPAQGELEGLSRIGAGDDFRSSRQRSIEIHLQPLDGDSVEVGVRLKEIVQDGSSRVSSLATETPLRESSAYDAFFEALERMLHTSTDKGLPPDAARR
jgi:hypothetical protein